MADSLYVPDPTAQDTLVQPWDEAFRAQRDVGLLVPINFQVVPSVSLTAACFRSNQYEDASFQKCFSNLLAVGLRGFVIDAYWDALRQEWSLCPVEIPPPSGAGRGSSTVPVPTSSISTSLSSSASSVVASTSSLGLKRQDGTSQSGVSSSLSSLATSSTERTSSQESSSATSATSSANVSTYSTPLPEPSQALGNGVLYELGDYRCTSSMTVGYLTGILSAFLKATSTTTGASFTRLVFNLHAAASWQNPNDPAEQPDASALPPPGNLLGDVLKGNLSTRIYTPTRLADQRAHLKQTWDDVDDDNSVRPGYYGVDTNSEGTQTTASGWPSEAFIQFREFFRLIAIFGSIDPQMSAYDTTQDSSTIFPASTLSFQQDLSISNDGRVTDGCLFDPSATSITATSNSSFALAAVPSSLSVPSNPGLFNPIPVVSNLTACGISPLLNHTLASATADVNPLPYAAFTHSYLWSWAPGEPLNATDPSRSGATGNRCAAAYTRGPWPGRWHVVDCNSGLRVACQGKTPYAWSITDTPASYDRADEACARINASFSVPHTPLENAHLLAAASAAAAATATAPPSLSFRDDDAARADSVLINLNSMDIADCWVAEVNASCPYRPPSDENQTRVVVVPTVAAVLIFVCTALTFFVKCAANRREDKRGRRRRMVGGWEYEGVPS